MTSLGLTLRGPHFTEPGTGIYPRVHTNLVHYSFLFPSLTLLLMTLRVNDFHGVNGTSLRFACGRDRTVRCGIEFESKQLFRGGV